MSSFPLPPPPPPPFTQTWTSSHARSIAVITVIILSATIIFAFILRHIRMHRGASSSSPEDNSLPIFTFGSNERHSTNSEDCAVCLSIFKVRDRLRLLPLCCHAFHVACIDPWLQSNRTCPVCRSPVDGAHGSQLLPSSGGSTHDHGPHSVGSFDYVVDVESEVAGREADVESMVAGWVGVEIYEMFGWFSDV